METLGGRFMSLLSVIRFRRVDPANLRGRLASFAAYHL
jgi:hypothetical protein